MLRSRVRRSFTVEVKSKNRQSLPWSDDPAPSPVNWAALDPAPETPSPFETAWPDVVVATKAPPVAVEKPRRILQSLIVAEPEPESPKPPAVEREPKLPRVRRVKPPLTQGNVASTEAARSDEVWSFADIADASAEPAVASPVPVLAEVVPAAVAPILAPHRPRAAEPAFAPGERWKRRLPRALR